MLLVQMVGVSGNRAGSLALFAALSLVAGCATSQTRNPSSVQYRSVAEISKADYMPVTQAANDMILAMQRVTEDLPQIYNSAPFAKLINRWAAANENLAMTVDWLAEQHPEICLPQLLDSPEFFRSLDLSARAAMTQQQMNRQALLEHMKTAYSVFSADKEVRKAMERLGRSAKRIRKIPQTFGGAY